jgi:selenide,water dikinase
VESDVKLTKLARCAGCGAKVGAGVLAQLLGGLETVRDENLLVGYDKSDDASVYRVSDELAIVNTVDFFPPIVDDPYTFGRIAATNALSDVYAMGGEPKLAQNILGIPRDMPGGAVREILRGGCDAAFEAGAIITGGHSIFLAEPVYGLAVTGFVRPDRLLRNCGALPGDALILTKPLGVGIVMTGQKAGLADDRAVEAAVRQMTALNRAARDAMARFRVHACTDVTGFSLMGHALEMAQGSGVTLSMDARGISLLPGALELARMGLLPEGMYRNRSFSEEHVQSRGVPLEIMDVLFGPETSGGLLIAVDDRDADALLDALTGKAPSARKIGRAAKKGDSWIEVSV